MPGKVFVNYRRDDERSTAARIRDRLAQIFGNADVFMDVDNLLAGQRFDKELEKALAQTDVFLAVIGPRWLDLLTERQVSGERDYVREEIAGALRRGIVVIPVLIERTPLPRHDALPEDLRDLVLHQKHVVTHEQFGRDIAGLIEAIRFARKARVGDRGGGSAARWVGMAALVVLVLGGGLFAYQMGAPREKTYRPVTDPELIERLNAAAAEQEKSKRAAEEAERQRLAMLKAEEDRKGAEAEAKRKAEGDAARRDPALSVQPGSGKSFRDRTVDGAPCPDCPEMVVVPAGRFVMGSPTGEEGRHDNEGPQRWVTIGRPFAVGQFSVTVDQFGRFVKETGFALDKSCTQWDGRSWAKKLGSSFLAPGFSQTGAHPAVCVGWHDSQSFVAWLSRKTGKTYRLPTEAEREYVTRAGTTTPFWWGSSISTQQANYAGNVTYGNGLPGEYRRRTVPVASFAPNPWGLYQLHGNVYEWVEDCWHGSYHGAPTDGSAWTSDASCDVRVHRGGAWTTGPAILRAAFRGVDQVGSRNHILGFRVARTID